MKLCSKSSCSKPGTMLDPESKTTQGFLCNYHWAEWWLEEMKDLMTEREYTREFRHILEMLAKEEQ